MLAATDRFVSDYLATEDARKDMQDTLLALGITDMQVAGMHVADSARREYRKAASEAQQGVSEARSRWTYAAVMITLSIFILVAGIVGF